MAERIVSGVGEVKLPNVVIQETAKSTPMDELMADYESACHEALFRSEDDEAPFDFDVARRELVDRGLSIVQSPADCDRILSQLDSRYPGLQEQIYIKRDGFVFIEIVDQFHQKHEEILKEGGLGKGDEILEGIMSDRLRLSCVVEGLKVARSVEQCQILLGITLDRNTHLRQLIEEKMALFPIKIRPS